MDIDFATGSTFHAELTTKVSFKKLYHWKCLLSGIIIIGIHLDSTENINRNKRGETEIIVDLFS